MSDANHDEYMPITSWRLLLHGIVALMVMIQIGMSGVFIYYGINQTMDGRISPSPLWLIVIAAIIAVDAFLVRWLLRMAEGLTGRVDDQELAG